VTIVEIPRAHDAAARDNEPSPADLSAFPAVAPGQLWLIELRSGDTLSASARHVLDAADVVIYDRALSGAVSNALPLGTYAEPAAQSDASPSRCVRFARDGWSVARLLPAGLTQRQRTRQVQDVVDELAAAKIAGRLPVSILTEGTNGNEDRFQTRFDDLASAVHDHTPDACLAIVINAFGSTGGARLHAVAGNGLAG
jgi:hypothetical protein